MSAEDFATVREALEWALDVLEISLTRIDTLDAKNLSPEHYLIREQGFAKARKAPAALARLAEVEEERDRYGAQYDHLHGIADEASQIADCHRRHAEEAEANVEKLKDALRWTLNDFPFRACGHIGRVHEQKLRATLAATGTAGGDKS